FGHERRRIAFGELVGRSIWVYGQQEVVKDLIAARIAVGGALLFDAEVTEIADIQTDQPVVHYMEGSEARTLECDFVAGCDGFYGVSRQAIPISALHEYVHDYPFAWVGILAAVPPSTDELIYASHDRGFALHSLRSPEVSRLYLQCDLHDDIAQWPDSRIWEELHVRLETVDSWTLHEGPIIEKSILPMRSYVAEPMRHGRLFLAGDSAHIVPPTGAKGLNLAVADVRVLARALAQIIKSGNAAGINSYTDTCLRRAWKVMHFSWWMTSMLHRFPDTGDGTQRQLQLAQLDYVTSSHAAASSLAEQYTGLPFEEH
ncbi:MAG: 4-hydroxybenzoate 3-monooxygenase, partial [Chloroflexi bacterium]|nr:4-hydroxybenzoate 3-monooxygenase [Chloroflexota bacterium]